MDNTAQPVYFETRSFALHCVLPIDPERFQPAQLPGGSYRCRPLCLQTTGRRNEEELESPRLLDTFANSVVTAR